jgi:uncharacterized membrane protein
MTRLAPRLLRPIRQRPRLLAGAALGLVVATALPHEWAARDVTRLILGWNAGAWLYLGLALWMMVRAPASHIQRRAQLQDEGARVILTLVALSSLASLGAIVAELAVVKGHSGVDRYAHIALAVLTIAASWAFAQVSFALHYAHDFYLDQARGGSGGLTFPDTTTPDYLDFLYFAAVIGTSGQTADVAFSSPRMRRIGLLHCVLSFAFNTSLIGLMINVASSLI